MWDSRLTVQLSRNESTFSLHDTAGIAVIFMCSPDLHDNLELDEAGPTAHTSSRAVRSKFNSARAS